MTEIDWRARLCSLREDLTEMESVSRASRQTVDLDQTKVGRLSRIDALQGQAMNNAISGRRRQALLRIEAALARLEVDEFGYCLECGEEIAEKRLALDPTVSLCIRCSRPG